MSNAAPQTGEPTMEEILASIRRIISEEEGEPAAKAAESAAVAQPPAEGAEPPEADAGDDDDVLELTEIVPEPAPTPEPAAATPRPRPILVEPDNDIAFDSVPSMMPDLPEAAPERVEGLVARDVVERAGAAFDRLHRDMAITESAAGNSIEGLVRQMLKPMLKQWLDDNLPEIVETIVREEVSRVASRRR
jgi:cell pole-organizing protein PopZ